MYFCRGTFNNLKSLISLAPLISELINFELIYILHFDLTLDFFNLKLYIEH